MSDETTDEYVRTLEMTIRLQQTRLDDYVDIIHQLAQEARPGHLEYMKQCYGLSAMTEHAEGLKHCAICNLLKKAKEIYSGRTDNKGAGMA